MAEAEKKLRVVLAKPGLDGHTRGIQHVARSLREAGVEVIYLGLYQTPEQVAQVALDEDVDAVGISVLSGAPIVTYCRKLKELLQAGGGAGIKIMVGGIIRPDEAAGLAEIGIGGVFGPGTAMAEILNYLKTHRVDHALR